MRGKCAIGLLAVCLAAPGDDLAPAYSAAGLTSAAGFAVSPLARYGAMALFGSNLSFASGVAPASPAGRLPDSLAGVQVFVANRPAGLLYVSPGQINFVVPMARLPGPVSLRVVRQGLAGPNLTVTLAEAAPAFFPQEGGYAVATHANGTVLSAASPAAPGEVIVLYATGLGPTAPLLDELEIPAAAAYLLDPLQVYVGGQLLEGKRVLYAGLTPSAAGLYQINLRLPEDAAADPEVRLTVAGASTAALKLYLRPQPAAGRPRYTE